AGLVLGRDPAVLLIFRPIAVAGHIRGYHRETALGHEAVREGHKAGSLLVLPSAVAHQDQGTGAGGTFWRPQHAGNLAVDKEPFADTAGRRLSDEAHSVSSLSGCLCGHSLGHARKGAPTCHNVDRSHLLSSQPHYRLTVSPRVSPA